MRIIGVATSEAVESWSLTSLREWLIKTGARLVKHARYAVFQLAEAALPRAMFGSVLELINRLRGPAATMASRGAVRSQIRTQAHRWRRQTGRFSLDQARRRPQADRREPK